MIKYILSLCTLVLFTSCGSTSALTEAQKETLETAVSTPAFNIAAQWAYPQDATSAQVLNKLNPAGGIVNGNRVLLDSGSYSIQVQNDSLVMNLPYFGTRQISGGLPGNTGITVAQPLRNFKLLTAKKEGRHDLHMTASERGETYDMAVTLFAGGNARVVISSSQRQSIRYTGTWQ